MRQKPPRISKPIPPSPGPPAGEIHVREMRLLAGGAETDKLVADMVTNATPPGWSAKSVTPPWATAGGACRSCGGGGPPLSVALLTVARQDERELLYTFAIVCQGCRDQPDKMGALKTRAFPADGERITYSRGLLGVHVFGGPTSFSNVMPAAEPKWTPHPSHGPGPHDVCSACGRTREEVERGGHGPH